MSTKTKRPTTKAKTTKDTVETKLEKLRVKKTGLTREEVGELWDIVVRFGDKPPLTNHLFDYEKLHGYAEAYQGESFPDLIMWCIGEWEQVIEERFGWMYRERPPEQPSIRFLCKFSSAFELSYNAQIAEEQF